MQVTDPHRAVQVLKGPDWVAGVTSQDDRLVAEAPRRAPVSGGSAHT